MLQQPRAVICGGWARAFRADADSVRSCL